MHLFNDDFFKDLLAQNVHAYLFVKHFRVSLHFDDCLQIGEAALISESGLKVLQLKVLRLANLNKLEEKVREHSGLKSLMPLIGKGEEGLELGLEVFIDVLKRDLIHNCHQSVPDFG